MTGPALDNVSAGVLLLWERGSALAPPQRALVLATDGPAALGVPAPNAPAADEPLGRHHARLLRLRAAAFGPRLEATAPCPACGSTVEFELDATVLTDLATPDDPGPLDVDGHRVRWRSPSATDLAGLPPDDAEVELLRRCVLSASGPDGTPLDAAALPSRVRAALAAAMEAADPLAEVLVDAQCPECGCGFRCDVDVPEFVWTEIEARAKQVLLDVDVLARAYGWTEPDVLALGDARRAAYLRIVTAGTP
jgi:hypothetical protein